MEENVVIKVENIFKKYSLGQPVAGDLRSTFSNIFNRKKQQQDEDNEFWALKNISFEVQKGEVLGIIGGNGAGKSTLLKILSRITIPTKGSIEIRGRVSSLLEVGTGFHPELTGRENIFLNGSLLGMKKKEIVTKFDEIVDFSGVEKFIDTPVKHYSSGMYVRLAFAVAAHLEPEILIVDEVLAVGDIAFRKKCLGKMSEVASGGRTIIFVSHNLNSIVKLCKHGLFLENGSVKFAGKIQETVSTYLETILLPANTDISLKNRKDRSGSGLLKFTAIRLMDNNKNEIHTIASGEELLIFLDYELQDSILADLIVRIEFKDVNGNYAFICNSRVCKGLFLQIPKRGTVTCMIPKLPLNVGEYHLDVIGKVNGQEVDILLNVVNLSVETGFFFRTGKLPATYKGVLVEHYWDLNNSKF